MKTLDNTNLGYLLTKIKNAFIRTTDVESVSEVTIDSTPTANSDNLVTSGGVHTSLSGKQDTIDSSHKLSADLIEDGTTNKVINVKPDWNAASGSDAEILNKPTIDNSPTQGSSNAVSSGGVYAELDDVAHIDANVGSVVSLNIETTLNKVTAISDQSTDVQYPSAKAVYDSLYKRGVVSQTQTWTHAADGGYDYVMSNLVWGDIPKDFINMVGMFNAVFNEITGYFELNELTDISYDEMRKIWFVGNMGNEAKAQGSVLQGTPARTNINTFAQAVTGYINMSQTCGYSNIEVFNYRGRYAQISKLPNNIAWCFVSCSRFKKFLPIGIDASSTTVGLTSAFDDSYSLEDIYIKNVKIATSFKRSSRLKLESIVYFVKNAANTSAITVTLHATAYARCQADTTEYTYEGQTYTGIIAYAAARLISIVSA